MKSLKLNVLEQNQLKNQELNTLKGGGNGGSCGCACKYVGSGGSSVDNNGQANADAGVDSPSGIKGYFIKTVPCYGDR